jgi:hypothetical protein
LPTDEEVLAAAQAIRQYLPELLGQDEAASFDLRLAELLAGAEHRDDTRQRILKLLTGHSSTRAWMGTFLGEKPVYRHSDLPNPDRGERDV